MFAPTSDATASATVTGVITVLSASASSSISSSCTISGTLTSGPQSQTVDVLDSITRVVVTFANTCSDTLSITATGLPPGIVLNTSGNVATLEGSPGAFGQASITSGTYNYTVTASNTSYVSSYTGAITVLSASASSTNTSPSTSSSSLGNFSIGSLEYYNGFLYVGTHNKILKVDSSGNITTYLGSGGNRY